MKPSPSNTVGRTRITASFVLTCVASPINSSALAVRLPSLIRLEPLQCQLRDGSRCLIGNRKHRVHIDLAQDKTVLTRSGARSIKKIGIPYDGKRRGIDSERRRHLRRPFLFHFLSEGLERRRISPVHDARSRLRGW